MYNDIFTCKIEQYMMKFFISVEASAFHGVEQQHLVHSATQIGVHMALFWVPVMT